MKQLIKTTKHIVALTLLPLFILSSCNVTVTDTVKLYQPKLLFEHDGIKVYRFIDGGGYVYFTNHGECFQYREKKVVKSRGTNS